ncbi:MAG: hypothetical protein H6700_08435 [Myxococcales bacterium]|nr:hypothetical protein [Myxococcales bacterium]
MLEKYGSLDGVYENLDALKGKQRENLETYRDQALLSESWRPSTAPRRSRSASRG